MLLRLLLLSLPALSTANPHWTEQDENDRISSIMASEKQQFDQEMKSQSQARYRSEYRQESSGGGYGGDYDDSLLRQQQAEYDRRHRKGGKGRHGATAAATTTTITEQPSYEALSSSEEARRSNNWCYFCASPLASLSPNSRKAVQQFLDIRRTLFDKDSQTRECMAPKNFSALQKQDCKHRFCQTLVLIDHEEGSSFIMRGCAEHFGAINQKMLLEREDNTCKKLHDKLDIRECICRERKSCYAGRERSTASYRSASLATVILMAVYRLLD